MKRQRGGLVDDAADVPASLWGRVFFEKERRWKCVWASAKAERVTREEGGAAGRTTGGEEETQDPTFQHVSGSYRNINKGLAGSCPSN